MTHTVVLVVGKDPSLLETRSRVLQAAGYIVAASVSPEMAIPQFLEGDFDLVILCHSIPLEQRKHLCDQLRQHTSRTPIVSVASHSGQRDSFVDATLESDPNELIAGLHQFINRNGNHPSPAPVPVIKSGHAGGDETQRTILFADDEPSVLDSWGQLLERAGYRVLAAQDGAEALKLFLAETVDAVVLDNEMPKMNGEIVAAQMRRINHDVPIILLSGSGSADETDHSLFNQFISKGVSLTTLLVAIEEALVSAEN